ncbi:MAG: helix-turn-helix transcriptional regulator [Xanthomonadaceae bacterium]|nr:helix-turn-helix transcriptional regulator [Xanthomonadaceae bacterium]
MSGRVDITGTGASVDDFPVVHAGMPNPPNSRFSQLLSAHMRRIRASAGSVATEIGMSRESVNNWRNGDAMPSGKHRDRVVACAAYLRLTEAETNALLEAAGFEPEYPAQQLVAEGPFAATVRDVFERMDRLMPYPILMLLSQAHWGQPPFRDAFIAEAARRFGASSVLHLQPPYSLAVEPAEYFRAIGEQCGLVDVDSDHAFEAALRRRLAEGERVFCLVSRFEQGDPALRETLAGVLRSLSETHSGRLHLLLCGGEALADLKYQGGELSLLNIADVQVWPEMDAATLRALLRHDGGDAIDEATASRLLRLSGGHPALLDAAHRMLRAEPGIGDHAAATRLAEHPLLWQALLPLVERDDDRVRLQSLLDADRLGRARPYLIDPMLRRLYWSNLLAPRDEADGRWLAWRCDAVRLAARTVLVDA